VRNRNLLERWRKWRRRRPLVLPLGLLVAVLVAVNAGGWGSGVGVGRGRVGKDLAEARSRCTMANGCWRGPVCQCRESVAISVTTSPPRRPAGPNWCATWKKPSTEPAAERRLIISTLFVERLGFAIVDPSLPEQQARDLEARCRSLWERRNQLLAAQGIGAGQEAEQRLQTDLLDLAVIGTTSV